MSSFESMIKIRGEPLPPPFITSELREEMQNWQRLAIKKETQRNNARHEKKPPPEEDLISHSLSLSTSLSQFMNNTMQPPDQSSGPSSPSSSTLDEETPTLGTLETNTIKRRETFTKKSIPNFSGPEEEQPKNEQEVEENKCCPVPNPDEKRKGTLIRSDSFTLQAPSVALSERLALSAPPPGPFETTPRKETPAKFGLRPVHSLAFSPVISERVSQKMNELNITENLTDPVTIAKHLDRVIEMERLLEDYHQLQLEELESRQEEERLRLEVQKKRLQELNVRFTPLFDPSESTRRKPECRPSFVRPVFPRKYEPKLYALIKGFLTRRLMQTERIVTLVTTIKAARVQLDELNIDPNLSESDRRLELMLINQLKSALEEIHLIMIIWEPARQMGLVARQRGIDIGIKNRKPPQRKSPLRPRLSSATVKSLARKSQAAIFDGNSSGRGVVSQCSRRENNSSSVSSRSRSRYGSSLSSARKNGGKSPRKLIRSSTTTSCSIKRRSESKLKNKPWK